MTIITAVMQQQKLIQHAKPMLHYSIEMPCLLESLRIAYALCSDKIMITIMDHGIGFDPEKARLKCVGSVRRGGGSFCKNRHYFIFLDSCPYFFKS